jgi:hypothetical protein
VDWSRAVTILPDSTRAIDQDLREAIAAEAQADHIEANIGRWAKTVRDTLRERGVLGDTP